MYMLCGLFYSCMSVWAIIQMLIMGILFKLEATSFIEDAEAIHYTDTQDFINQTRENYQQCAINCWLTAVIYLVILILSYLCIRKAKLDEKKREQALLDEDVTHTPVVSKKQKNTTKKEVTITDDNKSAVAQVDKSPKTDKKKRKKKLATSEESKGRQPGAPQEVELTENEEKKMK